MNIKYKNILVKIGFSIVLFASVLGFISLFLKGYELSFLGKSLLETYSIDKTPFEPTMLNVMFGNKLQINYSGVEINENLLEISFRLLFGYASVLAVFVIGLMGVLSKNINKVMLGIFAVVFSLIAIIIFSTVNDAIVFNENIDKIIKSSLEEYGYDLKTKEIWNLATQQAGGITLAKASGIITMIGSIVSLVCVFIPEKNPNVIVKMDTPNYDSSIRKDLPSDEKIS